MNPFDPYLVDRWCQYSDGRISEMQKYSKGAFVLANDYDQLLKLYEDLKKNMGAFPNHLEKRVYDLETWNHIIRTKIDALESRLSKPWGPCC